MPRFGQMKKKFNPKREDDTSQNLLDSKYYVKTVIGSLMLSILTKNNLFCANIQTVPPNLDVLSFFKGCKEKLALRSHSTLCSEKGSEHQRCFLQIT